MRITCRTVDISPCEEVPLGAGRTSDTAWGVRDRLEVNMVAFWPPDEDPIVVVNADLLYLGPFLVGVLEDTFASLPRERLLLTATHTHSAPMTDATKPNLGATSETYLSKVAALIARASEALLKENRATPVHARVASAALHLAVNRRLPTVDESGRTTIEMKPNKRGLRDDTATALTLTAPSGRVLAVVWNYACHPVALPRNNTVSANFPGAVRNEIRNSYGKHVSVLYLQGFSGNLRPSFLVDKGTIAQHVWTLWRERRLRSLVWRNSTETLYTQWADKMATAVLRLVSKGKPIELLPLSAGRAELEGELFVRPWSDHVSFQTVKFGDELSIQASSAEVVAEYAERVRELSGTRWVMPTGCLDNTFGYAPTQLMMDEGGYEAERFLSVFGFSDLNPNLERNLMAGFTRASSDLT